MVSFWSWNSFFNPNFHHKIYITFHFLQAIYIGDNYNIFNPNFNHEFFYFFTFFLPDIFNNFNIFVTVISYMKF